jgi:hypothetical protein
MKLEPPTDLPDHLRAAWDSLNSDGWTVSPQPHPQRARLLCPDDECGHHYLWFPYDATEDDVEHMMEVARRCKSRRA